MNEIIGFASAAIIGISLGLIGGGGSILTLPVLVYLFHLSPAAAISYSLFIVGSTSLAGAAISCWKKQINMRAVFTFGMASVVTVLVIRKFLIPYIPAIITHIGSFEISFSFLTMVLFALLMLITSFSMIRTRRIPQHIHHSKARLILYGIGIGLVTGFLGAGGGFLLIPALVMFMGMGMKKAIGTSLMIIAANSLIGFIADLSHYSIDWKFDRY